MSYRGYGTRFRHLIACFIMTGAPLLVGAIVAACSETSDPCSGVDCSGHGICFTNGSGAFCACFPGFAPNGHECRDDVPCLPEHCSLHGECVEVEGFATGCRCDDGFVRSPDGYFCFLSSAPVGDGDADVDSDSDVDVDADADLDADQDDDEPTECLENADCTSRSSSRCDLLARVCTPCEGEDDCTHIAGPNHCVDAAQRYCAECTTEDTTACDPQVPLCDPSTYRCVQCLSSDDCTDEETPYCSPTTSRCVACENDADCEHLPDRPICDTVEGRCRTCTALRTDACPYERRFCFEEEDVCVACLSNDHCESVTASRCEPSDHTCQPCVDDGHCAHLTGTVPPTTHCSVGTCVECTSYDHCDIGEGLVCNYTSKLCVAACRSCISNDECATAVGEGFMCGQDWPVDVPTHCMQVPPTTGCERPWVERSITLVGGEPADLCAPPTTTTCLGIVEFGQEGLCPPTDNCGENGVGVDGVCIDNTYCSYGCVQGSTPHEEWCPPGATCDTEYTGNCLRE